MQVKDHLLSGHTHSFNEDQDYNQDSNATIRIEIRISVMGVRLSGSPTWAKLAWSPCLSRRSMMISSRIKVCEILQGHKFKRNPGDGPKFSESSECCPAAGQHTDDSENSCLCWVSWLAMRIKQSLFSAAKRSVSSLFGP